MSSGIVVGVDVGSSSARALAVDRDGAIVADSVDRYPDHDATGGEIDPLIWLEGAAAVVRDLECPTPDAICISGHGPTTVASGGETALTFRHPAGAGDSPTAQHAAQAAILDERFGVSARQQWDWILTELGAGAGFQSVWPGNDPMAGFGDAVPVGSSVGQSDGSHGIPSGIDLVPGCNDAYMTAWAGGIDTPGRGFDPGGKTGGLGVAVAGAEYHDALSYALPSPVAGIFIVGGPVAAHGAMLDWWSMMTRRPIPELIRLAEAVPPGAEGVMVLPFFEGERAPRWNTDLRAEVSGLHISHDAGTVTRAMLEATGYGLAHLARDLEAQGAPLHRLVSSGGPARNRAWAEIKASILEVPVDIPACDEMAAFGGALAAGAALGWWPRPGGGKPGDWPHPKMTTIEPTPLDVYRDGLQRFIQLGDDAELRLANRTRE